jgi:hypothetical protein
MKQLYRIFGLNDTINPRISRISSIVFVVLMILSGFLLSTAGNYWSWYAMAAIFAFPPLVLGPRRYGFFGATALILSIVLIAGDIAEGQRFRKMIRKRREHFAVHQ